MTTHGTERDTTHAGCPREKRTKRYRIVVQFDPYETVMAAFVPPYTNREAARAEAKDRADLLTGDSNVSGEYRVVRYQPGKPPVVVGVYPFGR
jgi:hypothetical protein